jgi:seryl-tRNA synthetase
MAKLVQSLTKDNDTMRTRLDQKQGLQRVVELEDKLRESDQLIATLKKEIRGLQRIQNDQSKALQRVIGENEYPQRIQTLMDELRVAREKLLAYDERCKREEKNSI